MSKGNNNLRYSELLYVLLLFFVALSVYLIRILYWVPLSDELHYALTARDLLGRGTHIYKGIASSSPLFIYLSSMLQWIGLTPLLSVRLLSAFFGAGILPVSYLILSNFYRKKLAFVCSFSLLFLYHLNGYSRLGHVETIHIFFGLLGFLFLLRWSPGGPRKSLLIAGFFLGVAIWAKSIAIIYILSAIICLFLLRFLFREGVTRRDYFILGCGLLLPMAALLIADQIDGSSLFFEISQKGYEANMLPLSITQNIKNIVKNIIIMFGVPYSFRYFVGVPLIIICGLLLLRGIYLRNQIALIISSYLIVALPFFMGFSQKFPHDLLPSALFLFMFSFCEVGDYLEKAMGTKSLITQSAHAIWVPSRSYLQLPFLIAGVLLCITLFANIPSHSKLYFTKGENTPFSAVLYKFNPGDVILASHTEVFQYVNEEENLGLTILPLYIAPEYQLNWKAISDTTTTTIVMKILNFERLAEGHKGEFPVLKRLFPVTIRHKELVILRRSNPIYYYMKGMDAYRGKNYSDFLDYFKIAIELAPDHPEIMYGLARAYALAGKKAEAIKWLDKVINMGFGLKASEDTDFTSIKNSEGFKTILKKSEKMKTPINNSKIAFEISEKDLIPEGITYDPVKDIFYIGSIYKCKIIAIDNKGAIRDFTAEKQDGLWSVTGMIVDAKRRTLWVNSAAISLMKGFEEKNRGMSGVLKYDLNTEKLIKKYLLPNQPKAHLLNDLVINSQGDVFITDSFFSAIYMISHIKDELELFVKLKEILYPNGIAISTDQKYLYVSHRGGVSIVDMNTRDYFRLSHPENIALTGIDGMYFYQNSILAIQNGNGNGMDRVIRFFLHKDGKQVESAKIIEVHNRLFIFPTTGVLVDNIFYYIANSQIRSFNHGAIFPTDKLKNVVILKAKL